MEPIGEGKEALIKHMNSVFHFGWELVEAMLSNTSIEDLEAEEALTNHQVLAQAIQHKEWVDCTCHSYISEGEQGDQEVVGQGHQQCNAPIGMEPRSQACVVWTWHTEEEETEKNENEEECKEKHKENANKAKSICEIGRIMSLSSQTCHNRIRIAGREKSIENATEMKCPLDMQPKENLEIDEDLACDPITFSAVPWTRKQDKMGSASLGKQVIWIFCISVTAKFPPKSERPQNEEPFLASCEILGLGFSSDGLGDLFTIQLIVALSDASQMESLPRLIPSKDCSAPPLMHPLYHFCELIVCPSHRFILVRHPLHQSQQLELAIAVTRPNQWQLQILLPRTLALVKLRIAVSSRVLETNPQPVSVCKPPQFLIDGLISSFWIGDALNNE
eukprot:Gb_25887 [translate_table: standard]